MATLFTETWTGSNGAAWPSGWTIGLTPTGGSATIQSNAGRLTTGAQGSYSGSDRVSRRLSTTYTDTDVTVRFRYTSGEAYIQLWARANTALDTGSGYALALTSGQVALGRFASYSNTPLGIALDFTISANTWYWARFRVVGSQIAFKVWADTATEPSTWSREVTDTAITAADSFGVSATGGAAASSSVVDLDDMTVTDGAAPADTTAPTVPAGVTAAADSPTQVTVSWPASTDAVGVASYRVRRNGTDLAGATALTGLSFVDTTATANTAYSYTVSAVDAAGNRSAESTAATVTTPSDGPPATVRIRSGGQWVDIAKRVRSSNSWSTTGGGTGGGTGTATTLTVTTTGGDGQATLSWVLTPGSDGVTPSGVQVGRDGTDTSGAGPWATIDPLGTIGGDGKYRGSRIFTKLANGTTYTLHGDIAVNGAPRGQRQSASVTPEGATTPPPSGNRSVPLIGKSGMAWNSIVFGHGAQPGAFESWRGRPVDGVLYFPARQSWSDMKQLPGRRSGDLMVYSVPPFPEGIGGSNGAVASGSYDAQIRDFATHLINNGWNTDRTVIRLGWENNGSWYQWGWDRGGVTNWINAYRRFVDQCRAAGLTNVRWNWCLNKGPQSYNAGYSWTTAYPGDAWVDVVGIDAYDHYSPSFNLSQWQSQISGKNPGLQDVADFCRARGKLMSVDEWGVSYFSNGAGGGDNPYYVGKLFEFCKANADILAWDNTYDHPGAPASLNHKLSDGSNPQAAARYRQPYPNGWGA